MAESFFDFRQNFLQKTTRQRAAATGASRPVDQDGTNGAGPGAGSKPLTVSQLTTLIDRAIRAGLPETVLVRGEVAQWKVHGTSGHCYFTLKDARMCVDSVMWADAVRSLRFQVESGMEVIVSGYVKVYGERGRYQLYANSISPVGQGALELAFRQLCAKLQAEGLFAAERKKLLPRYPMNIALVTSRETAALQDMLKVLRRLPFLKLLIYHVPVQGAGAAERIAAALVHLNQCRRRIAGGIDLILLGRGGGSLQDLWAFNEEPVARAMASSAIPIITGIGHEVDTSVADLVADYHAHTPTEAAQVATQHWRLARDTADKLAMRIGREMRNRVQAAAARLSAIQRSDVFRRPIDRIRSLRQVLDDRQRTLAIGLLQRVADDRRRLTSAAHRLEACRPVVLLTRVRQGLSDIEHRLQMARTNYFAGRHQRLSEAAGRLREQPVRHRAVLARQQIETLDSRLRRGISENLARQVLKLRAVESYLLAVSPQGALRRGFTITYSKKSGKILRNAADAAPGQAILTRFADGEVESITRGKADQNQFKLFGES